MKAEKEFKGPWSTVRFWVETEDRAFLARDLHDAYLPDINRAVKGLEKFLDSRWPNAYAITEERVK